MQQTQEDSKKILDIAEPTAETARFPESFGIWTRAIGGVLESLALSVKYGAERLAGFMPNQKR